MKKLIAPALGALAASLVALAAPAHAALIYDFELNNSYASSVGPDVINANGGSLGATGYTFPANEGLSIDLPGTLSVYTIELAFHFDAVSGYRRIVDFKNLASDEGFYVLNGQLNFYPVVTDGASIAAGEDIVATISRDGAGLVTAWLNGTQVWSFDDSATARGIFNAGTIQLFQDDLVVGNEASSGFVDYVKVYDTALGVPGAVPEPATWGLMIGGFALAGAAMRRRKVAVSFA